MTLDEIYNRIMSAKTISKREYWVDRYQKKHEKVYKIEQDLIRPIRPINDILNDRKDDQ